MVKKCVGQADRAHHRLRKNSLIADIVNRENHRQPAHHRILGVLRAQEHRHQRRLPVVAMNHVRQPHAFHEFDGHAGKFREALGVVRIIRALFAVQLLAVEECAVVDEKIAHASDRWAFADCGKAQLIAERNGHAGNQNRSDLVPTIARQQHSHFMAHLRQRFRQRSDHVRQAASLRVRQAFRCNEEDFHKPSAEGGTVSERRKLRQARTSHRAHVIEPSGSAAVAAAFASPSLLRRSNRPAGSRMNIEGDMQPKLISTRGIARRLFHAPALLHSQRPCHANA